MKNLMSLNEFKKKNPKSCLDSSQLDFVSGGGQGTWNLESFGTNESSGYGQSWDTEHWHYGDGDNRGQTRASLVYIAATPGGLSLVNEIIEVAQMN